jgi:hypothetical protein
MVMVAERRLVAAGAGPVGEIPESATPTPKNSPPLDLHCRLANFVRTF